MGLFDGAARLFTGAASAAGRLFTGQPQSKPGLFADPPKPPVQLSKLGIFTGHGNQLDSDEGDPPPANALTQGGLGHPFTFGSVWNSATKTYPWRWDEAYSQSRTDALAMRRDCFLQGLLKERQYPTSQMSWHLEPADKKNKAQQVIADGVKAIIEETPDLHEMLMSLLDAIWYGRNGVQLKWDWIDVLGQQRLGVVEHLAVNGDKIQFEWDGTPQLWINSSKVKDIEDQGADRLFTKEKPPQLGRNDWQFKDTVYTDRGTMLRLHRPYWRDRYCIHKHDCIDADFFESDKAGGIHGVGVRHWIYWMDFLRKELSSYIFDYLARAGSGFTVYYYDPGNPKDKDQAIAIAKQQGRNTWIVWPRAPGESGAQKGVERFEANIGQSKILLDMLTHFDGYIERFIIGQTLSSGTEGSGLGGSGVAGLHKQTKAYIIGHDCLKLGGTLTRDFVKVIQRYNFPQAKFGIKWRFDIDAPDPEAALEAIKTASELGVEFDADKTRALTGQEKPEPDAVLCGGRPPTPGAAAPGGPPPAGKPPSGPPGQPAAMPAANGEPLFGPKKEKKDETPPVRYDGGRPIRYAQLPPSQEVIHYQDGTLSVAGNAIAVASEWNQFASYAADAGGALARLVCGLPVEAYEVRDQLAEFDGPKRYAFLKAQGEAIAKALPQPAPIHVHVPAQAAPVVHVHAAEAPSVTVNVPEQAAPVINYQAPSQPAPQVTVNVPPQPAPIVNVKPSPPRAKRVEYDDDGNPIRLVEEDI